MTIQSHKVRTKRNSYDFALGAIASLSGKSSSGGKLFLFHVGHLGLFPFPSRPGYLGSEVAKAIKSKTENSKFDKSLDLTIYNSIINDKFSESYHL